MLSVRRRRRLAWHAMRAVDVRTITFERDGIVWSVPELDDIAYYLFVDGSFQIREWRSLIEWMRCYRVLSGSRNVIADVGAHIGSTCIPLVREAGCRALAIEPVAKNFRMLKINVEANGLGERILLAKKAVLRAPERVTLCVTRGNSGGNFVCRRSVAGIAPGDVAGYEQVEGEALTAIIRSAGLGVDEIALVWADVQGCELEVIESGACLWEAGVPLWAEVEPHSLIRQECQESFAARVAAHFDRFIASRELLRLGAKAHPVPIGELEALVRGITPEQGNTDVLFLPPRFPARRNEQC